MTDPKRSARRQQPTIATAAGRYLPCFPAHVLAFVVDSWDRVLLFRRPGQPGWEVLVGLLEPGDTVQDAALRDVGEHVGRQFTVVYLGVLDTFTFDFDATLPPSIQICCLLRHRGGEIVPGKQVKDAEFRWWEVSELEQIDLTVPRGRWDLITRSVEMSRFLRDARVPEDEPGRDY